MAFTPGYAKRSFSEGDKQIALERQKDKAGVSRCACGCGAAVTRETAEFDHVIPYWLSRHSGLSNCGALTVPCHKRKTRRDAKVIARTKRLMKRRKARHPFPCGRESRFSKPIYGPPVRRTTLAERHAATMRKRAIFTQQPEA
jgi:hypothetical protein